jgi:hypothetical protein
MSLDSPLLSKLVEGHGTVAGTGEAMVVDNAEDEGGAGWKVSDFL